MRIRYLETAEPGLRWMRSYYRENPQLNRTKALGALKQAERTLAEFPGTGRPFQAMDNVFEYKIQGTSFSLLYSVARATVWVIDIRDQRGTRSAEALRLHTSELRRKYGIEKAGIKNRREG